MPDLWMDVDTALSEVPVNLLSLLDDTDFKSREETVAYNATGLELIWHFVTTGGATSATVVTPTTGGDYDWAHQDGGLYTIEIPASGGASINNDTEGFGWFSGVATGVLPWRGPVIGFRASGLNDLLIDNAYSATRGLAGTALPAAAADAAGGLPVSDAGGLDLDTLDSNVTAILDDTDLIDDGTSGLAKIATDVAAVLVDTGTTLDTKLNNIQGATFNTSTDSLEAIRDRGDAAWVTGGGGVPFLIAQGTIGSTGNDTTHLHLTGLPQGDDELNDYLIEITDVSESEVHARWITDWVNSTALATVDTLPFTPQDATDTYVIRSVRQDVTGGGGLDAAGVRAAVGLASADLDTQLASIASDVVAMAGRLVGLVTTTPTAIGSTGNDTTHLHLDTLAYGDDEIIDRMIVLFDASVGTFYSCWITDWVNSTGLATITPALPVTPVGAQDLYYLTSIRRDVDEDVLAILGTPADTDLATDIANLDTVVDALNNINWSDTLEGSTTIIQALRLFLAALTGISNGGGTTTIHFRDLADSKNRITATVDSSGNRSAMTLDGS